MLEPPKVGQNISKARQLKGISLNELSKRSGVSKSMLSQIEAEKANPTVITLWKISRALDTSVEELLEESPKSVVEVLRSEDTPIIFSEDRLCKIRINSPIHMTDNLELYQISLKPKGKHSSTPHFSNAQEFLTVLKGKIRVTAGSTQKILSMGDTARYKADQDHVIENLSDCESEAYMTVFFPK